jgi:hypothetical protein
MARYVLTDDMGIEEIDPDVKRILRLLPIVPLTSDSRIMDSWLKNFCTELLDHPMMKHASTVTYVDAVYKTWVPKAPGPGSRGGIIPHIVVGIRIMKSAPEKYHVAVLTTTGYKAVITPRVWRCSAYMAYDTYQDLIVNALEESGWSRF